MRIIKKYLSLLVIILASIGFSSCIDRLYGFETDYSTGEFLTPEMIESIIDANTNVEIEKYSAQTDDSGELIVYWLSGGSVWHISQNCSSVQKAENVGIGSVSDAAAEGKDRPCKICAKDIGYISIVEVTGSESMLDEDTTVLTQETLKYPKDYSQDGTLLVYWTNSGSVWHESINCPSLANTEKDNLVCGSEDEAVNAGKERVCKKCS